MSKVEDYTSDIEAMEIAHSLQEKFEHMFENLDITKIFFIRMTAKKSTKVAKTTATKFPFDTVTDYVYYVEIFNNRWNLLEEEQKNMAIFQQLCAIHPDGFDSTSKNYAKLRRKDVNEYSEVLCAAQMQYNWMDVGVKIPNILDFGDEETEAEESNGDAESED